MDRFAAYSHGQEEAQQQTLPLRPTDDDTRFLESFLLTALTPSASGHGHGSFPFAMGSPPPAGQSFARPAGSLQRQQQQQHWDADGWHPSSHAYQHTACGPPHAHALDDDGRSAASASSSLARALEQASSAGSVPSDVDGESEGWDRLQREGWIRAGGRDGDEDDDEETIVGRPAARAWVDGAGVVKTDRRGQLTGMAKMRNDQLRQSYIAAEPERRRAVEIEARKEERKEQATVVKTLLAQLRDTQALFAASVLHAGIASASLSASETKSLALKAELKRLKGELREAERAAERTARELDGVRRGEKEAKDRLGRYAEELKVRDARAVGRREGRNEALAEISQWAPVPVAQPLLAAPTVAPPTVAPPSLPPPAAAPLATPAVVRPDPVPTVAPPVLGDPLPSIAPSSAIVPPLVLPVVIAEPALVAAPASLVQAQPSVAPASAVPAPSAPAALPSAEEIKRTQLKELIAEVLAGAVDAGRSKAAYEPVIVAAPPLAREASVRSVLQPRPTSPRPNPPDYRPSARTTPPRQGRPSPSSEAGVQGSHDHHPPPAHFRPYSTAAPAADGKGRDRPPFDDHIFRPPPPSSGLRPTSRAHSQPATDAHPHRYQPSPRPMPAHLVRQSLPSQPAFKHTAPSLDFKSPVPSAAAPARPRPARGDTFEAVPGHQQARDSKYPVFTTPGFGERGRAVDRQESQQRREDDTYPRMRRYNEELEWFEGAERDLGTLPPSDGSSAAHSIILSPTPLSPPRLPATRPSTRPHIAAPTSPLSTYGDDHRSPLQVAQDVSGEHGRSRSLGGGTSLPLGPSLGPARAPPSTVTTPMPIGTARAPDRPLSLNPAAGKAAEKQHPEARNTFHGQSGWPGTSPQGLKAGLLPSLPVGDDGFPRRMDRLSVAPSLVIQPSTQSSKEASRKTASSDARPPPALPPKSPILPQSIPLPPSRTPTRAPSRADSVQTTTTTHRPWQPPMLFPTPTHPLNFRPKPPVLGPPPPVIPPKASSRAGPSGSSLAGMLSLGSTSQGAAGRPPILPVVAAASRSTSMPLPPPVLRPATAASTALHGLSGLIQPPVPPKDRPPPLQQQRSRSPAPSSVGTGWQSARASTVNSADSAWLGEHARPRARPVDPAAIHLPPSRAPSRARTPSLKESVGAGQRQRSRPPTNHGGTVASTIEEVEEDGTDPSKRRSQLPREG